MDEVRAGIWRHYKGPLYQVLGLAHDADNDRRTVAVYFGLQLDAAKEGPRLAVRNVDEWDLVVCGLDDCSRYGERRDWGCPLSHGAPRFQWLGPDFRAWMLK